MKEFMDNGTKVRIHNDYCDFIGDKLQIENMLINLFMNRIEEKKVLK